MKRALTILAALLLVTAVGCIFSEGEPENPTPDLQATTDAALARIDATRVAAAATPRSSSVTATGSPIPIHAPTTQPSPTVAPAPTATLALTSTPMPTPTLPPTFTPMPAPAPTPTPVPSPAATRTQVPTPTVSAFNVGRQFNGPALEKEIHQLINVERVTRGLAALDWDDRIAKIARDHSEDMASNDYFRHDNLKGQSPTDRGNLAGYPCRKPLGGGTYSYGLAENIFWWTAYSSYTFGPGGTRYNWMSSTEYAKKAVHWWMGSPGHRKNILTAQYDKTGIGVGFGTAGGKDHAVYLTQNFC